MPDFETVLKEMQEYFKEYGLYQSQDYYYGFFDALSVVRDMQRRQDK